MLDAVSRKTDGLEAGAEFLLERISEIADFTRTSLVIEELFAIRAGSGY